MTTRTDIIQSSLSLPPYPSIEPNPKSGITPEEERSKVTTKFVANILSTAISNVSSKRAMPPTLPITDHQMLKRGNHILGTTLSMIEAALSNENPEEYRSDILGIQDQLLEWGHQFLHNLPVLASEHDAAAQQLPVKPPNIVLYSSRSILKNRCLSIINAILPLIDSSLNIGDEVISRQTLENARKTLAESRNIFLEHSDPSLKLNKKNTTTAKTSGAGDGLERKAPPLRKKYSVLLAEDVPSIAKMVTRILTTLDCDVHWCDNGEKALRELLNPQRAYHIAFLDIDMPFLKGDEVVQRFTQEAKKAAESGLNLCLKKYNVPCLALTANTEDTKKYLEKGMVEVLGKPTSKQELKIALATHAIFEGEDGL